MRAWREYPYFFANLPLLALLPALIVTRRRGLSRVALLSGLTSLPCSLMALVLEGYWRPAHVLGGSIGFEDLIFLFGFGALVWLASAWACRPFVPQRLDLRVGARRMSVWSAASGLLLLALSHCGMDAMSATLATGCVAAAALLVRRRDLWPLPLTAVACFVPGYLAIVRLQLALWPAYIRQWNRASSWATAGVLGIPAGEIAWAVVFASAWPLLIASALDLKCDTDLRFRRRQP
jgi:hypothetical protein